MTGQSRGRVGRSRRGQAAARTKDSGEIRPATSPQGVIVFSPAGMITDLDEAAAEIVGRAPESIIGSHFSDCFRPRRKDDNPWGELLTKGEIHNFPVLCPLSGGLLVHLTARVQTDWAGDVAEIHAIVLRNAEEEPPDRKSVFTWSLLDLFIKAKTRKDYLKSLTGTLRNVSGCYCVGIRVVDEEGNIPYECHVGFARAFWEAEKHLSVRTDECFCTRVMRNDVAVLPGTTPGGTVWSNDAAELCRHLPGETVRRFRGNCVKQGFRSLSVIPVRYQDRVLGVIHLADERPGLLSARTIELIESMAPLIGEAIHRFNVEDKLKRNYKALQESNRALEQRTRQLRMLAAELSDAEQRERRRLAGILHDHLQQLLVGARFHVSAAAKRASAPLTRALGDIDTLLKESIEVCRSLTVELCPPLLYDEGLVSALGWLVRWMQEKQGLRVSLKTEIQGELVDDLEVRQLLFQAVRELLFNVAKHAGVKSAQVILRLDRPGRIRVEVADKGIGFVPPTGGHGTGFGLLTIRERLELLGGEFNVESAPGAGSRFVLLVPCGHTVGRSRVSPPPLPAEARATARSAGARIRVLLADDHKIMRQGLARLLEEEVDIEVVGQASNGQEALQLSAELHPDVVILDVNMPVMNGMEAARRIKAQLPGVKIIGLSMYEDDFAQAMLNAGAQAYLNKGGPAETLMAAIRSTAADD